MPAVGTLLFSVWGVTVVAQQVLWLGQCSPRAHQALATSDKHLQQQLRIRHQIFKGRSALCSCEAEAFVGKGQSNASQHGAAKNNDSY